MIIDDSKNQTAYGNLEAGDCFRLNGSIYFKVPLCNGTNAINLTNKVCDRIGEDDKVTKVTAKLIIE